LSHGSGQAQALSQVLRFAGKYVAGEGRFFFYYMFKTNFSGHNKIWWSLPPRPWAGKASLSAGPVVLKTFFHHAYLKQLFFVSDPLTLNKL